MSKPTGISHSTLSWVKKELDATLRQAAESLEIYSEDADDTTQLQFCRSYLHQVHGILQMLELFGAALLVEEMEQVTEALLRGDVRQVGEAQHVLMQAILQLGDYLERVQGGLRDIPLLLLPLLNELRAVRNAGLLTEHALFSPDLGSAFAPRSRPPATSEPLAQAASRLRSQYQRGLLGLLREQSVAVSLERMLDALDALDGATLDAALGELWWVATGFIEALQHGSVKGAATRMLLGQVDREIRRAAESGEAALVAEPRQDLLKNLLYYIAHAEPVSERIAAIQERYGLKSLLLDEQQLDTARRGLAAPNMDTLQTVASILKENLTAAKDSVDLYARSGYVDQDRLVPLAEGLRQIADTLGVLGLGVPRQVIKEQVTRIEALLDADATGVDSAQVMEIAEALLYVESAIDSFSTSSTVAEEADPAGPRRQVSDAEYRGIYSAAISEVVADIGQLKDAVVALIDADSADGIGSTVQRFEDLAATLRLLDKTDVAAPLLAVGSYIGANFVSGQPLPDAEYLDSLADALAGIEYYLEAVRDGHPHPAAVLDRVAAALDRLPPPLEASALAAADHAARVGAVDLAEDLSGQQPPAAASAAQGAEAVSGDQVAATRKVVPIDYDVPVLAAQVDEEILEIFIEEAGEVLETLRDEYPRWRNDPDNTEALATIRRMFHTLKGSGRLAGALLLGELAWRVESLLNRVLDRALPAEDVYAVVEQSIAALPALIDQIQGASAPDLDVVGLMRRADALLNPTQLQSIDDATATADLPPADAALTIVEDHSPALSDLPDESLPAAGSTAEPSSPADEFAFDIGDFAESEWAGSALEDEGLLSEPSSATNLSVDWSAPGLDGQSLLPPTDAALVAELGDTEALSESSTDDLLTGFLIEAADVDISAEPVVAEAGGMDPVLYDIFSRETADHLAVVADFIAQSRDTGVPVPASESLIRALHTLTGSARMADVQPVADIGRGLEVLAEHHAVAGKPLAAHELDLLERGAGLVWDMVERLAAPAPEWPDISSILDEIAAATSALADLVATASGPSRLEVLAAAEPDDASADVADADLTELFLEEAEDILRFLDSTIGRWESELDHTAAVADLQRSLHTLKGGARLTGFSPIGALCHALESLVVDVAEHKVPADDALFNLLHACADRLGSMVAAAKRSTPPVIPDDLLTAIAELRGSTELIDEQPSDFADAELVEVFLEEAAEILEATEAALTHWQDEPDNDERIIDLQRALHTLKGGARMAGFKPIADLSHALEALLVDVQAGRPAVSLELFDLLERIYDRLFNLREAAAAGEALADATDLLAAIASCRAAAAVADEPLAASNALEQPLAAAAAVPTIEDHSDGADGTQQGMPASELPPLSQNAATVDAVRVRADLLDNMVNLAGEVSIYRARLEQQVGGMRFNLGELDQTVARLREQLRTLEIETEAQILYRFDREYETADDSPADFDPLELDRFSRMQELSRALSESTNDLLSIQGLLDNLTRESETLLLQQSRVSTELQDGLMRTRMVPFANLVPRMRRIVRQTGHELGKKAQLKVLGARGEMDRTVLERVTASLEHMLRNAVAHGVEAAEVRRAAGKPEEGTITVALSREGADVVIRVSDDGSGLHLDVIRRKAISQGLMPADAPLTDREVMQFILEAGFSTSEHVTQIAGRGVGMDVVASEIKQLGGTLEIDSFAASGTTFTVRLPFTLAVNQALLCQLGDDVYAIPITSIEGVVRMTHEELEHCFANPHAAYYDYAGERYEVRGLSSLLGKGEPQLPGRGGRSPIILVHTGDHRLAIHVDSLLGSREIVVKSVGSQISTVPGIYGATILADGRVVLILDVSSLVRLHITAAIGQDTAPVVVPPEELEVSGKTVVMVVDDSITMRKVATRLLERNGMVVITAKDGVDAVARLQETVPDAMLLDIEMPRMDGYELATHMRNDERLQQVPIIMITSRTSEKHRARAFEIGVDRYLGKPYQEAELLESLQEVLEEASV